MHTNLRGAWLMSKAVGWWMWDMKRRGSFINVSSIAGLDKGMLPGGVAYGTSKAGLIYLTKMVARAFLASLFGLLFRSGNITTTLPNSLVILTIQAKRKDITQIKTGLQQTVACLFWSEVRNTEVYPRITHTIQDTIT